MDRPGSTLATLYGPLPTGGDERRVFEVLACPVMLRKHGELAHDERQLGVRVAREREPHGAGRGDLGLLDLLVVVAVEGMPLGLQRVERPDHVFGGDARAVLEPGFRVQRKGDPGSVVGVLHRLREEAVHRERLVQRLHHQRFEDRAGARCDFTLEDEGIQVVEAPHVSIDDAAAPGRGRVDVVEVREPRPILRLAAHRDPVAAVDGLRARGCRRQEQARGHHPREPGVDLCHHLSLQPLSRARPYVLTTPPSTLTSSNAAVMSARV